jgi:hypothetical protein
VVIFLQWVWIREIARYHRRDRPDDPRRLQQSVPGPRGWAIWFIVTPQTFAAVFTVSGIASLIASALTIVLPGTHSMYAVAVIMRVDTCW